jgi:hypothetical protein
MQPTAYTPATDFSEQEATGASGRSTVNTAALDAELAAIEQTLDETLDNLALLQRDDGAVRNLTVHYEALAADVRLLLASGAFSADPTNAAWVTATAYAVGAFVISSAVGYVCIVSHTSGASFAVDLAAGKWLQVAPVVFSASASSVGFTPTTTISASNAQAAIEEIDSELRTAANLFMAQNYGAL